MPLDAGDLQKLKQGSSGTARAEIAEKVASEFSSGEFNDTEKRIATEIFRLLVSDAEIQVRRMLSIHLAESMEAPHDVILHLARDVSEVSLPVLEKSYVLSEDDLIAITQSTQDVVIMSAIARRDMVSRELSQTLLDKSNLAVIEILLKNKSATIDEKALSGIYSTCSDNESILELMVRRGGLPVALAEKIFVAVSDEMKQVLTQQYKLSVQVADDTIKDAREFATLGLIDAEVRTMDIAKLVSQLYQQGRLTLSIIIRSLCLGDMRFFEHAMARLADVPVTNAQILVLDTADGFASLYKTSCLPMELYSATRYLLKIVLEETSYGRFQRTDFRQRLANRLAQDENIPKIEYMDYLLTLIQKNARDPQPSDGIENRIGPAASESSFQLSPRDVERLLTEEAPDVRVDVLKNIANSHAQRRYSLRELTIAEQILRLLVRDTEVSVREALAMALKDNPHVPRDIIISLTRDVDSVALPVIESSMVLTDADLLSLIQSAKSVNRPTAIARRKHLSEEVSTALVATKNLQVVAQLMKNPDAPLTEEMLQVILRDYSRNQDIMQILAQRPGLPVTVVEKIIALVSDSLAESLRVQYNVSPVTIAAETEKTREIATLKLVDGHVNTREIEKLVDQLQVFGRLTPSMILTSLCRGNLHFFETSLARLSNVPIRNAQLLIHDKGGLGFKALYNKAGLPEKFFSACKLLLEVVAEAQRAGQMPGAATYANTLAQKLLARSNGKDIENLSYIIALIRQHA